MIKYKISMDAHCDGCEKVLASSVVHKPADIDPTRWGWNHHWKKNGVLIVQRRYGQPTIYCQACADGNLKLAKKVAKKGGGQ